MLYWDPIIDFTILSILLLIATLIRAKFKSIQKLLIPNALLAGFIGLIIQLLFEKYFGIKIIGTELGEVYIYHLLNIAFAAIALTTPVSLRSTKIKAATSTGIYMTFIFCLQCLIGFGIVLIFINTIFPDLSPNFGFMMGLGYATGPGQAASIGRGFEALGFENGASVGLIFGTLGYFFSCVFGMLLIHWGVKKGMASFVNKNDISGVSGILNRKKQESAGRLTTYSEAIDTLTLQLALCGLIYLLAYGLVKVATLLLEEFNLSGVLWGAVFFIVAIIGIIVRFAMDRLKIGYIVDSGLQNRISGVCVDYLVTAAIMTIPIAVVKEYWIPLLVIGTLGGIVTLFITIWLAPRIWDDYQFERMVFCYGTLTGSAGTGMALLRVVDPFFKSHAEFHYALGMGLCLLLVIPLVFIIILLIGKNYLILIILLVYTCLLFFMWKLFKIWRPVKPYTSLWPNNKR